MKKRYDIVYVTQDSLQEGIGMSQIVPVVIGLASRGWKVGVLSCEKKTESDLVEKRLKLAGVDWHVLNFGSRGPLGGAIRILRIAFSLPSGKFYHCRSDMAAAACALRFKRNILWDVRSLWIDQKIIIENISPNSISVKIARMLERVASKKARAVTTLTKAVYPVLVTRNPEISSNHLVIPTCTDLEEFFFSRTIPKERRLLLSGVFNNYYDLDATRRFIEEYRKTEDLIVTWCHGKEASRKSLEVGEDEIRVLAQVQMRNEIAQSSFGLALCKTNIGDSLKGVMPTKIAEFLSVGRPVVVSEGIGDLEELLLSTNTGVILRDDYSKAISELKLLLNDAETPVRCRNLAVSHFDMSTAIAKYDSIFTKMSNTRPL